MGTWGIKIDQNDTFCETIEYLEAKLQNGQYSPDIIEHLINDNLSNPEKHIVIFGILEFLWQYDLIYNNLQQELKNILEEKLDEKYFLSCGATDEQLRAREKELSRFIKHLAKKNQKPKTIKNRNTDLEKGTVFWYKAKNIVYGAIVLDVIGTDCKYYLLALSEEIGNSNFNEIDILNSIVYSVAWFFDDNLLNKKRIHICSKLEIDSDYNGRAGMLYCEKKVEITNIGEYKTWSHAHRNIKFNNTLMKDLLEAEKLPKFYNQMFMC